jgi:hypothetical protein
MIETCTLAWRMSAETSTAVTVTSDDPRVAQFRQDGHADHLANRLGSF